MAAMAEPGKPPLDGPVGIGDQSGAVMAAFSILAGLYARDKIGVGQKIEVSGLGSFFWIQHLTSGVSLMSGSVVPRKNRSAAENPLWNYYCCRDGKWLMLNMLQQDRYWEHFCFVMGIPDIATDVRFNTSAKRAENCIVLVQMLDGIFGSKDRADWKKTFDAAGGFIYTYINSIEDSFKDVQLLANNYITSIEHPTYGNVKIIGVPINFSKTPAQVNRPAPQLGEHTEEILLEVGGYSWEEIASLRDNGAI
jgi:crotonobetainyl-CoA:carnitine CoA-transferase CaiB-like acyl-CoA transferase